MMSSPAIGLACLLFFAVSQGVRDAFFANAFQSVSFLVVAVLAFTTATVCFTAAALLRRPRDLARLFAMPARFAALNITTALAWIGFFHALRHLEPAVVATLYNGVGPLTVLALQARGPVQAAQHCSLAERLCYFGIAATLAALAAVTLTGHSGLPSARVLVNGGALAVAVAGGAMITVSHMIARWFNDLGVESDAVMGTRFLLTMLAAGALEVSLGDAAMRPAAETVPFLALAAFTLIMVPSFMLQLGVARVSPLAVNVIRALGPAFVFGVQQLDDRLRFSGATLACIVSFCAFAIAASVLRAWRETRAPLSAERQGA